MPRDIDEADGPGEIYFIDKSGPFRNKRIRFLRQTDYGQPGGKLVSAQHGGIDAARYITHRSGFDQLIDQFEVWLKPESKVIKAMVEL